MSSQTFDSTYRLRRPELEHAIIREIAQGSSLRRVALVLGINRKTVSRRLFRARRQLDFPNDTGGAKAATAVKLSERID